MPTTTVDERLDALRAAFHGRRIVRNLTYMGSRARTETLMKRQGTRATGERLVILTWLDDAAPENGSHPAGTIVVSHIIGDGRILPEYAGAMRNLSPRIIIPKGL